MTGDLVPKGDPERIPEVGDLVKVGEWYWVNDEKKRDFFGCVVHIGSNFAEFENTWGSTLRIHLDEFDQHCTLELDPEKVIRGHIEECKGVVRAKLGQIQKVTERLGLDAEQARAQQGPGGSPSQTRALSVISQTADLKNYKQQLIRAKDKELPKLFEEVEEAHKKLAKWMAARAIPARAMTRNMRDVIEEINGRVFNISLYAGLTEGVVQVQEGDPAPASEKLRLYQRLLYMDEECLLNYKSGGMEFKDIEEFDAWIAKPEHLATYLPHPRSMAAFRIRRNVKEREFDGSLRQAFIIMFDEQDDKRTYFYIRNGKNLWRMDSDLDLDEHIFPSRHELDLSEPMMAKSSVGDIEELIPKRQYDDWVKRETEGHANYKAWQKANPDAKGYNVNPYHEHDSLPRFSDWEPFTKDSVYYDEMTEVVEKRVKYYQRIALILQGLYDRSMIFHPHPRVCLWDPQGFQDAVELMYDADNILDYGKAPDFEAYRARCNAEIKEGSVTIGQEDFWERLMWDREKSRWNRRPMSEHDRYNKTHYRPYGDPGPGYISTVQVWRAKAKQATFKWIRERRNWGDRWTRRIKGDTMATQVTVPETALFNVSAYKCGDWKQFYVDPRTRQNYLEWAHLLVAAEEYHAGNLTAEGNLIKKTRMEKVKKPRKAKKRKSK